MFLITFFLFTVTSLSQVNKKSNLEIIEEDISSELEKYFYSPDIDRSLRFVFLVSSLNNDKHEKKFIEQLIRKICQKNKLKFGVALNDSDISNDSAYYKFRVEILNLRTKYVRFMKNKFLGEKSLERQLTSELRLYLEKAEIGGNRTLIFDSALRTSYNDEISYDDYRNYESSDYPFTQAAPPEISTFESVIFPVSVIIVSLSSVILFFIIRSK